MQRHQHQESHAYFQKIAQGIEILISLCWICRLEEEIACVTSSASSEEWYIDSEPPGI